MMVYNIKHIKKLLYPAVFNWWSPTPTVAIDFKLTVKVLLQHRWTDSAVISNKE